MSVIVVGLEQKQAPLELLDRVSVTESMRQLSDSGPQMPAMGFAAPAATAASKASLSPCETGTEEYWAEGSVMAISKLLPNSI